MKRCTGVGILALAVALFAAEAAPADETATDVNIITGLDISNSIEPDSLTLELAGMAEAISDPRVLKAIQAGEHRRIGFAVFAWHHGQFPAVRALDGHRLGGGCAHRGAISSKRASR